ncbi:ubiquitin-conjugating enzyme E2 [Thalassoglobus polymorphus]|uniref:Ubiquitin-conjugating enzyme n=1 Tax=Thalassoglobus polymorphus TaxID=2527994 RepID=A0A517QN69_9PLAN|nr:ubiquitin-conjugating enzyme E2 [Thalassoglobus polymorphus]QDT33081.1 Ubiquitin-conjugating enzyme [Thalassoglobus polymorphus]
MSTVRQDRLASDYAEIEEYARLHPRVRIVQVEGSPPERYEIEYRISSLVKSGTEVKIKKNHLVEIVLPGNYPSTPPRVSMLTPVFHPNIDDKSIYLEEHWTTETSLQSVVIRVGEMLAFQRYHLDSANQRDAVEWVNKHIDQIPMDEIDMHAFVQPQEENESRESIPKPQAKTTPSLNVPIIDPIPDSVKLTCPECKSTYTVRRSADGKKVQCKKCKKIFLVKL